VFQDEMLWMSAAGHLTVVWAIHMLEGLATIAVPSLADMSAAVPNGRAECVMLDKAPRSAGTVEIFRTSLRARRCRRGALSLDCNGALAATAPVSCVLSGLMRLRPLL